MVVMATAAHMAAAWSSSFTWDQLQKQGMGIVMLVGPLARHGNIGSEGGTLIGLTVGELRRFLVFSPVKSCESLVYRHQCKRVGWLAGGRQGDG